MPRDKSKSKTVLGRPQRPDSNPTSQNDKEEKKELKGTCVSCGHCDLSATGIGYCENPRIKRILETWDGVLRFPDEFGCKLHSELTKESN